MAPCSFQIVPFPLAASYRRMARSVMLLAVLPFIAMDTSAQAICENMHSFCSGVNYDFPNSTGNNTGYASAINS